MFTIIRLSGACENRHDKSVKRAGGKIMNETATGKKKIWDDGFEVEKARAKIRKKGIFSAGGWHHAVISRAGEHGVVLITKLPIGFGDRVESAAFSASAEDIFNSLPVSELRRRDYIDNSRAFSGRMDREGIVKDCFLFNLPG